jgi:hypothetical protein
MVYTTSHSLNALFFYFATRISLSCSSFLYCVTDCGSTLFETCWRTHFNAHYCRLCGCSIVLISKFVIIASASKHVCPPQIPHELAFDWTIPFIVIAWRLTCWVMLRSMTKSPEIWHFQSRRRSSLFLLVGEAAYSNKTLPKFRSNRLHP